MLVLILLYLLGKIKRYTILEKRKKKRKKNWIRE